jgi:hypothetical protein
LGSLSPEEEKSHQLACVDRRCTLRKLVGYPLFEIFISLNSILELKVLFYLVPDDWKLVYPAVGQAPRSDYYFYSAFDE